MLRGIPMVPRTRGIPMVPRTRSGWEEIDNALRGWEEIDNALVPYPKSAAKSEENRTMRMAGAEMRDLYVADCRGAERGIAACWPRATKVRGIAKPS